MKKRSLILLTALLATMTIATTASGGGSGMKKASFLNWWASSRYQTANVLDLVDFNYSGAATLTRERNKISGRIMANVTRLPGAPDTPGGGRAHTVWIIVVNNPGACLNYACLPTPENDDLLNPATRTSVFNGNGAIVEYNDTGGAVVNVDFAVEAGKLPEGLFVLEGSQYALRYGNGFKAIVLLVIDQHPPIEAGGSWVTDLTTTVAPGGANASVSIAAFLPCPEASCPESAL